ncbi:MAG TPA: DUF4112 domain-containing protein [Terriglobales bacterium]|jgi:hypothetical protein|nr:DUF4112 domain-containing protein [Terriglobales bacterium]
MPQTEPEILSPRRPPARGLTDEQLNHLAGVLDDIFHIPGTKIRFGLDPIVGLVPGLGDIITGLLSFLIVFAAWQRGLPKIAISRMVANIAIDTLLGSIPIVGDVFDTVWKSNRMNYNLLVRYRVGARRRLLARDWLFFLLLLVCAAALVVLPIVIVVGVVHLLRGSV